MGLTRTKHVRAVQYPGGHWRLQEQRDGRWNSVLGRDGTVLRFDTGADARRYAKDRGWELE